MGAEDHGERLARIEAVLSGIQGEMTTMREALMRLVRIEEAIAVRDAHARETMGRVHARLDAIETRLDETDKRVESMRGPLLWLSGIAATVVAGAVSVLLGRVL